MATETRNFAASATARGFLAARPFVCDNCAKSAVFAGGGNLSVKCKIESVKLGTGNRERGSGRCLFSCVLIALCAGLLFAADAFALDAGDTLRVMTYNIQYAYCFDDNKTPHPDTVAARIVAENPDVCCLQECKGVKGVDTPARIAEAAGMHLYFFNDEAILSKDEPIATETVDLQYYKTYTRYLLIAEFGDYVIANTHMSRTSEYGLPEVDVITNALAKYEGKGKPILFMGDLNTRPGFTVYNKLAPLMQCISPVAMADGEGTYCSEKNTDGEYTWNWILDFIYMDCSAARSGEWSWTSHVVKDHATSDHAPVVADLTYIEPYKFIRSGWPVDNPSYSAASSPISGFEPGGYQTGTSETAVSLEARFRTWLESLGTRLRSDKASGMSIHLR